MGVPWCVKEVLLNEPVVLVAVSVKLGFLEHNPGGWIKEMHWKTSLFQGWRWVVAYGRSVWEWGRACVNECWACTCVIASKHVLKYYFSSFRWKKTRQIRRSHRPYAWRHSRNDMPTAVILQMKVKAKNTFNDKESVKRRRYLSTKAVAISVYKSYGV